MIGTRPIGLVPVGTIGTPSTGAGVEVPPVVVGQHIGWFEFDSKATSISDVTITPGSVTLSDGEGQTFVGIVSGNGAFNPDMTWSTTAGSISASGNLVLPSTTVERMVTVTLASVQNPTKTATATVIQLPAVVIEPPPDQEPVPDIGLMERFARPVRDVARGTWEPSTGTSLYAMVDDMALDNSDYISAAGAATCELALAPVRDPQTSVNQVVRYLAHAPAGGGLTVELRQGSRLIASWSHATLPATPTVHEQALTAQQCDSITDYGDLRIKLVAA